MNPVFETENITPPSPSLNLFLKKKSFSTTHYKVNETLSTSYFSYRPQVQIYKVYGQHLASCECHLDY